ncbi:hypothetical protein FRC06_004606 [Ceratobasidium sp. 370]|nr:hypothetical protein FRC06_004606 [Ceratobasidium sp. 370]
MASSALVAQPAAGYATHFRSNRRNIEYPWYISWIRILTQGLDQVDPDFYTAGQHALTSWGRTREQIPPLEVSRQTDEAHLDEATDEETSDDELAPLKTMPKDSSYNGKRAVQSLPHAMELRTQAQEGSPDDPFAASTRHESPKTPDQKKSKKLMDFVFPSSTETYTFKKSRDSFFLLDFAVIKILSPQGPAKRIFGIDVYYHDTYIPVVIENKPHPTRQSPPPDSDFRFQERLSDKLSQGYEDLNKKLPAAFVCHHLQKSIIAISAVGHWWSFTVVSQNDKQSIWSRAFCHGLPNHDNILRDLFQAALQEPSDPLQYQDGLIQRQLTEWARTVYDGEDTLATDTHP